LYAYFADSKQAQIADSTQQENSGKGLDFGEFCSPSSAVNATGVDFTETKGISIARGALGAAQGTQTPTATILSNCNGPADTLTQPSISGAHNNLLNHVVR